MTCGIKLEARRNADFRVTFTPASRNFTFSGMVPLFSVRLGDVVLLQVGPSATPNGSNFVEVGDSVVLTIEKADMALLDSAAPDTSSEVLFFDVTLTDGSGFENWLTGGPFILLGLNDVTCGGCNSTIEASFGGQCIQVSIEGGNLAAGASLTLQELNEAAARAEQAAEDAEAAAASIPALVADKADTDGGNITPVNVQPFRASIGVSAPTLAGLKATKVTESIFVVGRNTADDGYAGTFEWLSGDQYAGVFEDPLQGIWVPRDGDPTGSLGAWKRVFDGGVNVRWFGAGLGGDDTPAFSAAARLAPALDTLGPPNNTSTVPRAPTTSVYVPAGSYILGGMVDVQNKEVTWILDSGAKIAGSDFINGRTMRPGLKSTQGYPSSILDSASGFTSTLGGGYSDKPAPITGVASVAALANYPNYDTVAVVGANYSHPPVADIASASYTGLTVTVPLLTAEQRLRLRRGMVIKTKHATPYVSAVDSWTHGATSTVFVIKDGWYLYMNSGAGPQTPANGTGLFISPVNKIWGANFVVNLSANGAATQGIGTEVSYRNLYGPAGTNVDVGDDRMWGNLVATVAEGTPGFFVCQAAYIARGWWEYGFVSDSQNIGLYYKTVGAGKTAIKTRIPVTSLIMDCEDPTDGRRYRITGAGDTAHGDPLVASGGRSIQFHTSGLGAAYDARINASGGTAGLAQGTLTYNAVNNLFGGTVRPTQDNVYDNGAASFRWRTIFAGTGTINTSDETTKADIGSVPDEWLDAWGDVEWVRYKFRDAIALKGDDARWHTGLVAQQIERAFSARGLDAFEIGLLCRDRVVERVMEPFEEIVPVMEGVEEETTEQVVEDDRIVLRTITRTVQKPKEVRLPVVDESGAPVMEEVLDPDAPEWWPHRTVRVPMMRAVPVTETVTSEREVERETDEWRYGVRYTEALAMEAAWARREMSRS